MLVKFSVSNFKNFRERIELDFRTRRGYGYNGIAVDDGVVTKAVVYGKNGSGKTNLALALFDIVLHLTDNARVYSKYEPYLNMDSDAPYAEFEYTFSAEGKDIVYSYAKRDAQTLVYERVTIDGRDVLRYDFDSDRGFVALAGTENVNLSGVHSPISRVKYVMSNVDLRGHGSFEDIAFLAMNGFVDRMLMFQSFGGKIYQGISTRDDDCIKGIIREGRVKGFENFLKENGIVYELVEKSFNGGRDLFCRFGKGDVRFRNIASSGTMSLAVFYYWRTMLGRASLVFMDEFDAFYHSDLAERIVESLKSETGVQIMLSTHDTDLLSNDILRPDCYFLLHDGRIDSLDSLTDKDLREAHNLQRMYKAGSFGE